MLLKKFDWLWMIFVILCISAYSQKKYPISNQRPIYVGDTVYLLKPKVIVRKHFGEDSLEYRIDSSESEGASLELANNIKSGAKQKVKIIDLEVDESKLQEFYACVKPFLESVRHDTTNLGFNFSKALIIVSMDTRLKYPLIVSNMEWDYDYKEFYGEMNQKYGGFGNGRYQFSIRTTFIDLIFFLIDSQNGNILKYRKSGGKSSSNYGPTFENYRFDLHRVMHPFLKSVIDRKEVKNNAHH